MARVPLDVGYRRALRLRCAVCGEGRMFSGLVRMNERCSECGFKFERDPGYFLGSTYINYGWTAVSLTIAYMVLHVGLEISNSYLVAPLIAWCVLFPLFFHRYARALWSAFDCFFDYTELPDVPQKPDESPTDNGQAS